MALHPLDLLIAPNIPLKRICQLTKVLCIYGNNQPIAWASTFSGFGQNMFFQSRKRLSISFGKGSLTKHV
jgi:hypothetical protein